MSSLVKWLPGAAGMCWPPGMSAAIRSAVAWRKGTKQPGAGGEVRSVACTATPS
ncbi:hypothetical protein OG339_48565 (plasmid) [Streptosporangium sp. NBC_01495]|uniref:hypothetical protein n=1 Tax=Streptosporangium sp. NBC_01495 TaxID=2903899 RepID=UPI002E31C387|nr:hypothetical protein [Streptosporangium sp. NBC_01495]